ncbi:ComF family protein [Streptomyces boninensis]|uniref:ComF family protein n=1 Tax=Streptomyces boninensis TaxID=2039455 RepID=UPI003B212B4D
MKALTALILPIPCAGCGAPRAAPLCRRCTDLLASARPRPASPNPRPSGLPRVHALLPYEDEPRAMLLAHKERGALRLAAPLGAALAAVVRAALAAPAGTERADMASRTAGRTTTRGAPVLLTPVPSTRRSVALRGHDPARRLALAAAAALRRAGVPARTTQLLRQRRLVADQSGLTAGQRRRNLHGALEPVPSAAGLLAAAGAAGAAGATTPATTAPGRRSTPTIILVDDLITTGATLTEAARALRDGLSTAPTAAAVVAAPRTAFACAQTPGRPPNAEPHPFEPVRLDRNLTENLRFA